MRAFDRRLNKLEYEFGVKNETRRMLVLVSGTAQELVLDHDACVRILDEAGFLASSGCAMVNLYDVPEGLSVEETKRFLREHGDQLCYPRRNELAGSGSLRTLVPTV